MNIKYFLFFVGLTTAFLCLDFPAQAAEASWSAQNCGKEPVKPTLELNSIERYNASVEKVTAYEKEARAYYACALKEAKKEYAPVLKGISSIHARMTENFNALNTQMQIAHKKLGSKK